MSTKVLVGGLCLVLVVVVTLLLVRWRKAADQRWLATWEVEAQELGLGFVLDEAAREDAWMGMKLQLTGELEGRSAAVSAQYRDYDPGTWLVRIELGLARAPKPDEAGVRETLESLRKKAFAVAELEGKTLIVERKGRCKRPGELQALVAEVLAGAATLEALP